MGDHQYSLFDYKITFSCQQANQQIAMLKKENKQIDHQIQQLQQDLRLIRCQTTQNAIETLPKSYQNLADLTKILKMKNNQLYFKQKRQNASKYLQIQSTQSYYFPECYEILQDRVYKEKQQVIELLRKKKMQIEKSTEKSSLNVLKNLESYSMQQHKQKVSIFDYMKLLGREEELKVCQSLKICNDSNREEIDDLIECLKHIANVSEPIKMFKPPKEYRQSSQDLSQFQKLFHEIRKTRNESEDKSINLLDFINQCRATEPLSKLFRRSQYFDFILKQLKNHSKQSPFHPKKLIWIESERIYSNIELFLNNSQKQKRFMTQELNESEFWQKVCFLFSKGPEQYYLLQYHLKYMQEHALIEHFHSVLSGRQSNFTPKLSLLSSEQYYRQFLMLLDCKYLSYCLSNQEKQPEEDKLIYVALRQISFLLEQNKSFSFQLNYLKKAASKMLYNFKVDLLMNKTDEQLKNNLLRLFALGQQNVSLDLLYQFNKITTLEYIFLLSIIQQFDVKHSKILLYDHKKTTYCFQNQLRKIIQANICGVQVYYSLLSAFLPAIQQSKENHQQKIAIIGQNRLLFEYLMQFVDFQLLAAQLLLSIEDIPILLESSIARHQNYAYCLQLALSACFSLVQIPNILIHESNQYRRGVIRPQTGRKVSSFENLSLDILLGASNEFLGKIGKRFEILISGFKMLVKINLLLIRNSDKRETKYEQITFINELYQKLATSKGKQHLWEILKLNDSETVSNYNDQLSKYTNMLILTFNMLKIKNSIKNRQFQSIVEVLNCLFEKIASNLTKTAINLENLGKSKFEVQDILFIFIGDVIQAILFLSEGKPKVIDRNRTILKHICQQIYSFLLQLKSHETQSKSLFRELQKIMSSMNYFKQGV